MGDEMNQATLHCALLGKLTPMKWPSEADLVHGAWVAGHRHAVEYEVGQQRPPGGGPLIFRCQSHPVDTFDA